MEVLEIGQSVLLAGDIPAVITAISIRGAEHYVAYDCAWWDGRTRKVDWIPASEIKVAGEAKRRSLSFKVV